MDDKTLLTRIREMHPEGAVARVEIEGDQVRVFTARPGIVMGKRAAKLAVLIDALREWFGRTMQLGLVEVRHAEVEPLLVADIVRLNLERGVAVERMQKHVDLCEKRGGQCRIELSGARGDHTFESEGFAVSAECEVAKVEGANDEGAIHVTVTLRRPIEEA